MSVTIKFGADNQAVRDNAAYTTAQDVLNDASLRGFLGFGDNVALQRNGLVLTPSSRILNGDVIEVVTRAGSKG